MIFGAAQQNLKIVEMPLRDRARTHGATTLSRFRHGAMLAGMTLHALKKFKGAY
jgi:hypothetical protein